MNPTEHTTWQQTLAEDVTATARRYAAEILASRAVDDDGALDETARILALKRGCRR